MAYYNDQEDGNTYENWHRYGRERGFFDRASDEVRSWFGDQEAENRRRRDMAERAVDRAAIKGRMKEFWIRSTNN